MRYKERADFDFFVVVLCRSFIRKLLSGSDVSTTDAVDIRTKQWVFPGNLRLRSTWMDRIGKEALLESAAGCNEPWWVSAFCSFGIYWYLKGTNLGTSDRDKRLLKEEYYLKQASAGGCFASHIFRGRTCLCSGCCLVVLVFFSILFPSLLFMTVTSCFYVGFSA